ncbi:MAG: murein peptide amidase [Candidatus Sumerlaeota bacterium]|nr:murein peptide amidase [Candidatus Sumerlaeota bacterium]
MLRFATLAFLLLLATACARGQAKTSADNAIDETYHHQFRHIAWEEVGRSVENRPIYMAEFGDGDDVTLFFTCFHGNESSTPRFGYEFANLLHNDPTLIAEGKKVVIVPILNPDGLVHGTRNNARDVDLNRNYPTSNWGQQPGRRGHVDFGEAPASEPETRTVLKLMAEVQPDKILTVHQPRKCNNNDGPNGLALAELLAEYNGYPVEPYIGYPTPGSYGTYAGKELGIPMVTLELPRGTPDSAAFDEMWRVNRDGLLAFVNCNLEDLNEAE